MVYVCYVCMVVYRMYVCIEKKEQMAYYELVYQLEDWFVVILTIG